MTVSAVPATLPDYDRNDWKHWSDADRDCQDARNEVLIAESRTKVAYRTDRKCRVAAGEWLAPYSNTIVTDPGRLDVDHMVPLGNTHDSGAWQWSANRREQYANYLEDPQHLIAVTASANRSKGARGPEQWKPEDRTYRCQYATDWINIKSTWELTVTESELAGLNQMLSTCTELPSLWVSHGSVPGVHRATSTPEPRPATMPAAKRYRPCDAAHAAGETRIQGTKRQWSGFPKVDGAQHQGRRRRRRRVREVTGRRTLGYNIEALPDPAALLENKTPTSASIVQRDPGVTMGPWLHHDRIVPI